MTLRPSLRRYARGVSGGHAVAAAKRRERDAASRDRARAQTEAASSGLMGRRGSRKLDAGAAGGASPRADGGGPDGETVDPDASLGPRALKKTLKAHLGLELSPGELGALIDAVNSAAAAAKHKAAGGARDPDDPDALQARERENVPSLSRTFPLSLSLSARIRSPR